MTAEQLLELQLNDTAIEQIQHRIPRLPEVLAGNAAAEAVRDWDRRAAELNRKIAGFEAEIAASEKANDDITVKRDRLEKQLKTVIAPREAEALMHEIALLNTQRSDLDDAELAALEGLGEVEAALVEHRAAEDRVRATAAAASEAAAAATAVANAEVSEREGARDTMRGSIETAQLALYDRMRTTHGGVAVAKLNGLRCEGCHLDMSVAEVDSLKRQPAGELGECPNCGRLLVR